MTKVVLVPSWSRVVSVSTVVASVRPELESISLFEEEKKTTIMDFLSVIDAVFRLISQHALGTV